MTPTSRSPRAQFLVFDVDGTICFDGRSIGPDIAEALREARAAGPIAFASARPIRDLLPVLPEDLHDCLLIGGNGAFVRRPGEPPLVDGFDAATRRTIDAFIDRESVTYLIDGPWDYSTDGDTERGIYRQLDPGGLAANVARGDLPQYAKAVLFTLRPEHVAELTALPLTATVHPLEGHVDLSPVGIDKGATLARVLDGVPYVGFGNDVNDRTLFRGARLAVCVGDSPAGEDAHRRIDRAEVAATIRALSRARPRP